MPFEFCRIYQRSSNLGIFIKCSTRALSHHVSARLCLFFLPLAQSMPEHDRPLPLSHIRTESSESLLPDDKSEPYSPRLPIKFPRHPSLKRRGLIQIACLVLSVSSVLAVLFYIFYNRDRQDVYDVEPIRVELPTPRLSAVLGPPTRKFRGNDASYHSLVRC
jgi:hypothetical protein